MIIFDCYLFGKFFKELKFEKIGIYFQVKILILKDEESDEEPLQKGPTKKSVSNLGKDLKKKVVIAAPESSEENDSEEEESDDPELKAERNEYKKPGARDRGHRSKGKRGK